MSPPVTKRPSQKSPHLSGSEPQVYCPLFPTNQKWNSRKKDPKRLSDALVIGKIVKYDEQKQSLLNRLINDIDVELRADTPDRIVSNTAPPRVSPSLQRIDPDNNNDFFVFDRNLYSNTRDLPPSTEWRIHVPAPSYSLIYEPKLTTESLSPDLIPS